MRPMSASQQLGAVPGITGVVPGFEGHEPEDYDGAEFASSGEAETAPRDFDSELPDNVLEAAHRADQAARERNAMEGAMNYVEGAMNYMEGYMNYEDPAMNYVGQGERIGIASSVRGVMDGAPQWPIPSDTAASAV